MYFKNTVCVKIHTFMPGIIKRILKSYETFVYYTSVFASAIECRMD
jgi:hypothetical protein